MKTVNRSSVTIARLILILSAVSIAFYACGGGGGGGGGGGDSTAPTAVASLPDGSPLDLAEAIIVAFSESMDTGSLVLSGDLAGEDDGGVWSMSSETDDTLTISPAASWTTGTGRTLMVDAQDLAGNAMSTLLVAYDVPSGTIYYVSQVSGADTNDGLSSSFPKRTIMGAVNAAPTGSDSIVLVAAGNYQVDSASNVDTQIKMKEEVSLYGGYSADFSSRDPVLNVSSIADQGSSLGTGLTIMNRAVEVGSGITTATILDGFSITGGAQLGDWSVGVYMDGGSMTLRNCVIDGGQANFNSYGIRDLSSASIIADNIISGGSGPESSRGIEANNSTAVISGNSINGGVGSAQTVGITCAASAAPTITNNLIEGGTSQFSSYGIFSIGASPTLNRNSIRGGSGTGTNSWGVALSVSGTPILRNNTIDGGHGSASSYGIVADQVDAVIQNNTVTASSDLNTIALNVWMGSPTIENNILSTSAGVARYCIRESEPFNSDPAAVRNNDLTGCPTALYFDEGSSLITSITVVNNLGNTTASGNVSVDPVVESMAEPRLTASSPTSVTQGGLDLSGSFTTDRDGAGRTVSWSIGAYEYD